MASSSDTSRRSDKTPALPPLLPDKQHSQGHIADPNQIGVERQVALLADKQQALVRAVVR